MQEINKLKELINNAQNIVFFGGAGVSTESNIPDFRSAKGLYNEKQEISPEVILSHDFFLTNPQKFFEFYQTKMLYPNALPNDAHYALTKLEKTGKLKAIITQNIDGLHQAAGSQNVYELHGTVHKNHCPVCHREYSLAQIMSLGSVPYCPKCQEEKTKAIIKPDVVLYGEMLDNEVLEKALVSLIMADLVIVGGTSLTVNPAAGLISYCNPKNLVIINLSETPFDDEACLVIKDKVGNVLKQVIE